MTSTTTHENIAIKVYHDGIHTLDIAPVGVVLIEGVQPPSITDSGVLIPGRATEVPVQFAQLHRIKALPDDGGLHPYRRGQYVVCRSAHIDPIGPSGKIGAIGMHHIIGVVKVDDE